MLFRSQQIGEPNEIYQYPTNMFVAGFIGTPAMNFIHGELLENGGFKIDDSDDVIQMTKEQMLLLKNYVGHRLVYGIRPENLVYEKDEAFHKLENYSLTMTTKMVELLGDIINVHGSIGQKNIILKTTSAFKIKANETIRVAIKPEQARFFNETTTKAITMEYYDFEEVEVTESLDEDNVIIVEEKKKGLIAKALNKIKDRKKEKDETKDL